MDAINFLVNVLIKESEFDMARVLCAQRIPRHRLSGSIERWKSFMHEGNDPPFRFPASHFVALFSLPFTGLVCARCWQAVSCSALRARVMLGCSASAALRRHSG
jgi:hypothetical protein